MDLEDTPKQAEFRARLRRWLAEHRQEAPSQVVYDPDAEMPARREWQRRLADAGFVGASWPLEYGGGGLTTVEDVMINQELAAARVPGVLNSVGIGMVGPALIKHGTEEMRRRHLPALRRGDEMWCELFSEPSAGSDLAAVRTGARRLPDGRWSISGQKVWTTLAQNCAYGLLLARTDPTVPKHRGLTTFVVPMDAPGVTTRPLRQITGASDFCEVFFDDVILESDAVVGEVGRGWGVAIDTLMFERLSVAVTSESRSLSAERLVEALRSSDPDDLDAGLLGRAGAVLSDALALRFSTYRAMSQVQHGTVPGVESGLMKITADRVAVDAIELVMDVGGLEALGSLQWTFVLSYMPGLRAGGGSEDILRNTIGERYLGLAPEPRFDKDVPFDALTLDGSRGAA